METSRNYRPLLLLLVVLALAWQINMSLKGAPLLSAPSDVTVSSLALRSGLVAIWIGLLFWTPMSWSVFTFLLLGFCSMLLTHLTEWAQLYWQVDPFLEQVYAMERLASVVFLTVGLIFWSLERRKDDLSLRTLSATDSLTGLYNTRYFYQELEHEIKRVRRYGRELALVLIRVEGFKTFNEEFGYSEGDRVLKTFGQSVLGYLRRSDLGCRFGANEFAILLPETPRAGADLVGRRFKERLDRVPHMVNGKEVFFPVSVAVAQLLEDEVSLGLVRRAEQQLQDIANAK